MTAFRYRAVAPDGRTVTGQLEAAEEIEATRLVAASGLVPIEIVAAKISARPRPGIRRRLRPDESVALVREWSTLLSAGLTVDEALSVSLESGRRRAVTDAITRLRRAVRDGQAFHRALAEGGFLAREALALVEAGEAAGALPRVLERLADDMAQRRATEEGLATALLYPAVLLVTTIAALAVIVLVVAPNLAALFEGAGGKPPARVAALLSAADWIRFAAPLAGGLVVLAIAALIVMAREESGRRVIDTAMLRLPFFGSLLRSRESARFASAGALMIECGVVPTQALPLAAAAIGNRAMRSAIDAALTQAARGTPLTEALAQARALPTDLLAMIGVGLRTGRLADVMRHGGALHAARVRARIERFGALLTPAITVFAGAVVGGLAYMVLTAVTSLNEVAFQ
ncbi:type II secretion system F family protein [Labrys wisconsinensis]|uniref:General secretion pathway protein F n=1 Tax=Labrys wisconsinensis TaxID=425677 RepID=A0ABU0JJE4_9HYPH|nr:type II secretion system F family protein [Labrys wisconsinensis]MDQ0473533.1 general secretion pathway protein F [Labrys wisconsinensis]